MKDTNDISKAVALFYDGEQTPIVSAKGIDEQAQDIIRIAQQSGVSLCENALLVELLSQIEVGDAIPKHLYTAVAQILSFAYRLDSQFGDLSI